MGAWGVGPFENDGAADWLAEFEEDPAGAVEMALGAFDDCDDDEIPLEVGQMVVAAAEALAAAIGQTSRKIDLEIVNALREGTRALETADDERARALAALDRIEEDGSEIAAEWAETKDRGAAWKATVEAVRRRLG